MNPKLICKLRIIVRESNRNCRRPIEATIGLGAARRSSGDHRRCCPGTVCGIGGHRQPRRHRLAPSRCLTTSLGAAQGRREASGRGTGRCDSRPSEPRRPWPSLAKATAGQGDLVWQTRSHRGRRQRAELLRQQPQQRRR